MPRNRHGDVVGLDIGAGELKVAVVRDEQAIRIGHARIPEGIIVDGLLVKPDALAAELRRLWRKLGLRSKRVNFAVANQSVLFRLQALPRTQNPDDLNLALTTNAEIWFAPMTLQNMVIDYAEQQQGQALRVDLEICAADKTMINSYIRALRKARLVPVACQYGPLIESRALAFPRSLTGSHVLINIGAEKTSFVATNGLDVIFSRLINLGGNDFTRAIAERLSLPFDVAEKLKLTYGLNQPVETDEDLELVSLAQEALLQPTDRLVQALADMRAYYERQPEGRPTEGITLMGGGARLAGLTEQVSLYLETTLTPLTPQGNFDIVPDLDLYAGAIGLGWQQPMSLMPSIVGASDKSAKGPTRSKVDRKRAEKVSRQLKRRQSAANPLLVMACLGFVGFLGMFMYGTHLKNSQPALASTPSGGVSGSQFTYSGGDANVQKAAAYLNNSPPLDAMDNIKDLLPGVVQLLINGSGNQLSVSGKAPSLGFAKSIGTNFKNLPGFLTSVDQAPTDFGSGPASFGYSLRRAG
jgi:type IV pilus assembly protein PilM